MTQTSSSVLINNFIPRKKQFLIFLSLLIVFLNSNSLLCSVKEEQNVFTPEVLSKLEQNRNEIEKLVTKWKENCSNLGFNVCEPKWLPGFFIKLEKCRVENAKKLEKIIQKNYLNYLSVAPKYKFVLKPNSETTAETSVAVAKKIDGLNRHMELNLIQTMQLVELALRGFHQDLHTCNLIKSSDNKVFIIDTDNDGMTCDDYAIKRVKLNWFLNGVNMSGLATSSLDPLKKIVHNVNTDQNICKEFPEDCAKYRRANKFDDPNQCRPNFTSEAKNYLLEFNLIREENRKMAKEKILKELNLKTKKFTGADFDKLDESDQTKLEKKIESAFLFPLNQSIVTKMLYAAHANNKNFSDTKKNEDSAFLD